MEKPPSQEDYESRIEELLAQLDGFALDEFPVLMQNEIEDSWYLAEMQAKTGKDREKAYKDLGKFVARLESLRRRTGN